MKLTEVLILGAFAVGIAATAEASEPSAATPSAVATKVATVGGITEYRLDNGLRFLLVPDRSQQQIAVDITYLVGSRHEGYGETGMAHLLEHLVFKGTPNHPHISQELIERGASYNATTFIDRTSYYETFPAEEDNLAWALGLEADRMVNSYISAKDIESEMTVVRNEWELHENDPVRILKERVLSTAFLWHNYGNAPIGARADIENVPIERLQAFYRKYYQPDNAVLVVAGRFDPERAVELVAEKFGPIPRPDRSAANRLYETCTVEPTQDGERTVTLRRVGDVQLVAVVYHVPSGSHAHFAAVQVLGNLLGAQPAGRLYKNVVETGLAAETFTATDAFKEPGVLLAGAKVRREGDLSNAAEALLATLQGFADKPPTAEEVDRAKRELAAEFEHEFSDPGTIGGALGHWAAVGNWRLMFVYRDRAAEVTPDDVLDVAKAYLKASNRTVGYFHPADETPPRAEIPASPDVAALVSRYTGGESVAEGEAFEPTPANIESRTTRLTLAGGVEVALLPKENRGHAVSVSFSFRHGTEDALMGRSTVAESASIMLTRGTVTSGFGHPWRTPPRHLVGRPAFLQGMFPGATSPKSPCAQARAVFEGVAPAPPVFRSFWASRPGGFRNSLLSKALARPQVFRGGGKQASRVHGGCFAGAFSPKQRTTVPRSARPQPFSGEEGHRDGAAGLRYADVHSRPGQGSSRRSSAQCSSAGTIPTIAA